MVRPHLNELEIEVARPRCFDFLQVVGPHLDPGEAPRERVPRQDAHLCSGTAGSAEGDRDAAAQGGEGVRGHHEEAGKTTRQRHKVCNKGLCWHEGRASS